MNPRPRHPSSSRETLLRQAARLLRAGVPLHEALPKVAEPLPPGLVQSARQVADALAQGTPLDDAFRQGNLLTPSDAGLLALAGQAGTPETALEEIAGRLEASRTWRQELLLTLAYPAVLIHLCALLPSLPIGLQGGPGAALAYLLATLLPIYALCLPVAWLLGLGPDSLPRDQWRLRLPLLRDVFGGETASRLAGALACGIRAAARWDQLLPLAGAASGNAAVGRLLQTQCPRYVAGDLDLAGILEPAGILDTSGLSDLRTGEISGTLDQVLPRIAADGHRRSRQALHLLRLILAGAAYALGILLVLRSAWVVLAPLQELYRDLL